MGISEEEGAFVLPWNRRDGRWCRWLSGVVLVVCHARSVRKVTLESLPSCMEETMHGIPCWMTSEHESGAGRNTCLENLHTRICDENKRTTESPQMVLRNTESDWQGSGSPSERRGGLPQECGALCGQQRCVHLPITVHKWEGSSRESMTGHQPPAKSSNKRIYFNPSRRLETT